MRLEYFQMVDRITALDIAGRAGSRRRCQVPEQSPVFEGHFPGHPILPGVLMIETMAQTGGWLVLATLRFARMPFLMQVEKAKMRSFVVPGQALAVGGRHCCTRVRLRRGEGQHRAPARQESGGGRNPVWRRAVPERNAAGGDAGNRPPHRRAGGTSAMTHDATTATP